MTQHYRISLKTILPARSSRSVNKIQSNVRLLVKADIVVSAAVLAADIPVKHGLIDKRHKTL